MKKICKMSKKDLDMKKRYDELNDSKLETQKSRERYIGRLNNISDEAKEVNERMEEEQILLDEKKDLLESFETKKHSLIYLVSKKNREMIDNTIRNIAADIYNLNDLLETDILSLNELNDQIDKYENDLRLFLYSNDHELHRDDPIKNPIKAYIEYLDRRVDDLDKQMKNLKESLANEEVIDLKKIISGLEHNAWYGGNTTVYLQCGDDIARINAYTYEIGYESFSTASSFYFNDECLFELNSRNIAAYRYESYTSGKFETMLEAVDFIETKFDGKDVCITDVSPQQQSLMTEMEDSNLLNVYKSSLYTEHADAFMEYDEDEEVEEMQEEPEF